MKLPDPPVRKGWVRNLSPAKRSTALIREYLESRIGCVDANESRLCKSMLRTYATASAGGNPKGHELSIGRCRVSGSALIYISVDGLAKATELPSLVVAISPRITHILREVSEGRLFDIRESKPADPFADEAKRGFPGGAKVETKILPGRRA